MKKRLFSLLLAALILAMLAGTVSASERSYIFDNTDVFSEQNRYELNNELEQLAAQCGFNVCYLRTQDASAEGYSSLYYQLKGVYQQNFNAEKGLILGYDVANQIWNVYVSDDAKPYFTAQKLEEFWDVFISSDTYPEGVRNYAAAVKAHLDSGIDLSPAGTTPKCTDRLNDMAGLLSESEAAEVRAMLDEISERQQFDVAIVTTDYLGGKYYVDYADDYFDYNHFGFGETNDGAVMLISVEPDHRMCYISTCGSGINLLNDDRIDTMLDEIVDEHLRYGEYYESMVSFANLTDKYVTPMPAYQKLAIAALICIVLSLISAAIRLAVLKGAMKSVRRQSGANSYIVGKLNVTRSSDLFLYRTVTKTVRESSSGGGSSSHTSSSGASHGGGGRSF